MLAAGLVLSTAGLTTVRADVHWEHTGHVSIGKKNPTQLLTFGVKNSWSGRKYALGFNYDATRAMGAAESMAPDMTSSPAGALAANAAAGDFTLIQRHDDDKFLVVTSNSKQYMEEPLGTLPARLRLNIWEGLDPALDSNPPQLTPEQRKRLGREIRAAISPFTRKMTRFYFRQLPNKRTINGMETTGYRVTAMVNSSLDKGGQEWTRMAAEWWLAGPQPGDDEVLASVQESRKFQESNGGVSASMWSNEMPYVLLETMPDELLQAWTSLVGTQGTPRYGFQGVPVQMFMTVSPPPATRLSFGDVRMTMELKKHSTDALPASTFQAPADFKKVPLEPLLKLASNAIKQMQKEITKELGQ